MSYACFCRRNGVDVWKQCLGCILPASCAPSFCRLGDGRCSGPGGAFILLRGRQPAVAATAAINCNRNSNIHQPAPPPAILLSPFPLTFLMPFPPTLLPLLLLLLTLRAVVIYLWITISIAVATIIASVLVVVVIFVVTIPA